MREGMQGLLAALRPAGVTMIIEDICVAPSEVATVAKDLQALLGKHGFLPGVAGHASAGNLHFMLTPNFGEAGRSRALRRLHARAGRADRRQVRRLAEGRARHRRQHGAVRRARVGAEGDRADVARQAARRPRRHPRRPESCSTAIPSVHLRNLKSVARDRGGRDQVHRVRVLRAGLPVAQRDDHAAPADRAAPRDGAPAGRVRRCSTRCSSEYEYDGLETCAADGSCAAACPVAIDTGKLVKELRRRDPQRPSGARRARARQALRGRRARGPGGASCRR